MALRNALSRVTGINGAAKLRYCLFGFVAALLINHLTSSPTAHPSAGVTSDALAAARYNALRTSAVNTSAARPQHAVIVDHKKLDDPALTHLWGYCDSLHGGTKDFPGCVSNRMLLANLPHVKTACETGFAQGHSGLIFLHANPSLTLYSFEIMQHGTEYKERCVDFVRSNYGDRFQLVVGNSSVVVPRVRRYFPSLTCDLMAVDNSALSDRFSDLTNFQHIASCNNLVIHRVSLSSPEHAATDFRTSQWTAMVERGDIEELYCHLVESKPKAEAAWVSHYAMDCVGKFRVLRSDCVGSAITRKDTDYEALLRRMQGDEWASSPQRKHASSKQASIGMFTGSHPVYEIGPIDRKMAPAVSRAQGTRVHEGNPVIAAADLWDIHSASVTDGLLIRVGDWWYMYFSCEGRIGYAVSVDGTFWRYGGIVLSEQAPLRFPFTIQWGTKVYMVVSAPEDGNVRLYEATAFPDQWTMVGVVQGLAEGIRTPVLHYTGNAKDKTVYLFGSSADGSKLHLYFMEASQFPTGTWSEHSSSPMSASTALTPDAGKDAGTVARWSGAMAGHIVQAGGLLVRFATTSDNRVYAWVINQLTPVTYSERPFSDKYTGGPARSGEDTKWGVAFGGWRSGGVVMWDALPRREYKNQWLVAATGLSGDDGVVVPRGFE